MFITEAADELQPQRPTNRPEPERGENTFLYVGVGLLAVVFLLFIFAIFCVIHVIKMRENQLLNVSKKQPFSSHSYHKIESFFHQLQNPSYKLTDTKTFPSTSVSRAKATIV